MHLTAVAAIVWNAEQGRVRAGWRLLLQALVFVAILLGVAYLAMVLGSG